MRHIQNYKLMHVASLPFSDFVELAYSMEGKESPFAEAASVAETIQRELAILAMLKERRNSPLDPALIDPGQRRQLSDLDLGSIAPSPGVALGWLRSSYLDDPSRDLSEPSRIAAELQDNNLVPHEVPPIASLLLRVRSDADPTTQEEERAAVISLLCAQACLRAIHALRSPDPGLVMRSSCHDPAMLTQLQALANRLLLARSAPSTWDLHTLSELTNATLQLVSERFPELASLISDFWYGVATGEILDDVTAAESGIPSVNDTGRGSGC